MGKWLVSTYSQGQVILIQKCGSTCHSRSDRLESRPFRPRECRAARPAGRACVLLDCRTFLFLFRSGEPASGGCHDLLAGGPIYVAALAPFLLGEKVGWRRWTAIAIGFVGVLIALKPSSASLTSAALFSILGSAAFAFMMLSGRQLRNTPDTVLAFWQIIGAGLAGIVAVFMTPSGWLPVQSSFDLAFLSLLGVVAMAAHVLVNRALKLADAATVAPLQYTLLLWAVIFGWLFFNDVPQTSIVVGAGLIVLSGLYIFPRKYTQATPRRGRQTGCGAGLIFLVSLGHNHGT